MKSAVDAHLFVNIGEIAGEDAITFREKSKLRQFIEHRPDRRRRDSHPFRTAVARMIAEDEWSGPRSA